MRFRATILQTGKNTAGIQVPPAVVEGLGAGKRPPVTVTLNGLTYRTSVAVMGGAYWVGLSGERRAAAGVAGGDVMDVDIELDTAPREIDVPADFAAALDAEPVARAEFDRLSYSNKSWHTLQIEGAKSADTRARRIAKSVAILKDGRPR
jgi:hypothetical protein